jgi:hypothetical protein
MKRLIMSFALALSSASMLIVQTNAQSETKTKIKTEHGSTVTYMGCIGSGTQSRTYVLQNVQPISRTETTNANGTVTSSTTYALVPEGTVELQQNVGRRVEITGVLIEAGHGDAEIKQRTKTNGHEEKTKTEIERESTPQLKVLSVKPTGGNC